MDGKVTREEIEKLIYELNKSEYWIPAFPNDGRTSHSWIIVTVLCIWLFLFLFLGGTHQVTGLAAFLVTAGALLLAYLLAVGAYYWAHNPISDIYLNKRERAFIDVVEKFNTANSDRDFKVEVGRYGAYIALRFNAPIKQLGAMLMNYHRVYKQQQSKAEAKKQEDNDIF